MPLKKTGVSGRIQIVKLRIKTGLPVARIAESLGFLTCNTLRVISK